MALPVVYAQGLAGQRWQYYGGWAKYVPVPMMERLGRHLPIKPVWTEAVPCGDGDAELTVLAGSPISHQPITRWIEQPAAAVVLSRNLQPAVSFSHRWQGRGLALGLLRRIMPALVRELELLGDGLTAGLAVADWERPFWIHGLEQYARNLTAYLQRNERCSSLAGDGLAIRHAPYGSGKADVHLLLVAPERMEAVAALALREGTLVVSTDGRLLPTLPGCCSVELSLADQMGLPACIWADHRDQLPVLEAVALASCLATGKVRWPDHPVRQIAAMDEVLAWSGWPAAYRLHPGTG